MQKLWKVCKRKEEKEVMRFEFTREEIANIKSKIYLTNEEEKVLDMRLLGKSIVEMAMILNVSESTISRIVKRVKNKIKRVI